MGCDQVTLTFGDCMAGLRKLADRSVDHFIFDPPYNERTSGGGTTAVACQELGRRFLGWEDTRETFDKATHRIKEAGKQQPLFSPKAAQATQLQLGG